MANEQAAAGVEKILKAARSISTRYKTKKLTNILATDRTAIDAGLAAIGDTNLSIIITSSRTGATPLPGAAVTDTLAPNQPTGLSVVEGASTLTWSWDPSFDNYDGTSTASGVKEYDLELDGSITVVSTANTSVLPAPTFAVIGSYSPPPSHTQTGDSHQIVSAGTGIDGTADQCAFLYWSVSGDFKLQCRVDSFTGAGGEYALAGLMVRESTAAGSIYTALYQWLSALSRGVQHKKRTATDGAKTTGTAVSGNGEDRWLQIERSGSTFTYRYSIDGGAWTTLATETVTMNSAVLIGTFCSDLQASPVPLTATFLQTGYTTVSRPSYVQTTTGSHTARVRARDLSASANVSTWAPSVTGAASDQLLTWNPGHYAMPDHHMYPSKYTLIESDIASLVTPTDKRAKLTGVRLLGTWGMFEPTQGNYDFSKLDYFIAYAKARGLRSILSINVRRYGGAVPSVPQVDYRDTTLPDYVITNGWAGLNTDDLGGYSARLDITACMTAYLAMIAALGAHLNSEPYFEMFETGETSAAFATGQGYSSTSWNTQWLRVPAALRAAFPNKPAVIDCNYHNSVTNTNTLVDDCIVQGTGIGGPDTMPQHAGTTDDHWGFQALGGAGDYGGGYDFGTSDRRGSVPAKAGQEVIQDASYTPASIYTHAYDIYRASHMTWTMHADGATTRYGVPVPAMEWETGVWPYLRDNSVPMRTAFPTRLTTLGYSASTGAT